MISELIAFNWKRTRRRWKSFCRELQGTLGHFQRCSIFLSIISSKCMFCNPIKTEVVLLLPLCLSPALPWLFLISYSKNKWARNQGYQKVTEAAGTCAVSNMRMRTRREQLITYNLGTLLHLPHHLPEKTLRGKAVHGRTELRAWMIVSIQEILEGKRPHSFTSVSGIKTSIFNYLNKVG